MQFLTVEQSSLYRVLFALAFSSYLPKLPADETSGAITVINYYFTFDDESLLFRWPHLLCGCFCVEILRVLTLEVPWHFVRSLLVIENSQNLCLWAVIWSYLISAWKWISTLRPRQYNCQFAISTPSTTFSWMKMLKFRLQFHRNLFLRVQITILQHWFR